MVLIHSLNTTKGSARSEAEFLRAESLPGAMAPEGGTVEKEREYTFKSHKELTETFALQHALFSAKQ